MIINSREKKSYLRAKWEHYETEEVEEYCFEYKYDDDRNLLYYEYNDDGTRAEEKPPIIVNVDSDGYLLDDNGEPITQILDEDGNPFPKVNNLGEALTIKDKRKTKIFTNFTYNIASQGTIEKLQYIYNSWSQDVSSTIYTTDNIKVKVDDRIIINDKAYTIKRIYSEINDSTASMFNFNGYCVTYIELKGGLSL